MSESSKKYWTDDPELMEKYVLGRLSDDQRSRFDSEIADCEPCKEKLRREMMIVAGIRRHGRDTAVSKLRLKLRRRQSSQMQQYGYVSLVAAVIVIAIGVGVYTVWFNNITFPKKFGKKEIILHTSTPDSASEASDKLTQQPEETETHKSSVDGTKNVLKDGASPNVRREADALSVASSGAEKLPHRAAAKKMISSPAIAARVQPFSQKVWLLGTVVMLSKSKEGNANRQVQNHMAAEQGVASAMSRADKTAMGKSFSVKKSDGVQHVVIKKRSLTELPVSRRTQFGAQSHIETFVEHNESGLFMTLYNDNLDQSDIEHATVEITDGDSLLVTMHNQQIIYRLPESWNFPEHTLRR